MTIAVSDPIHRAVLGLYLLSRVASCVGRSLEPTRGGSDRLCHLSRWLFPRLKPRRCQVDQEDGVRHLQASIEHAGLDHESPGTGRQMAGACDPGGNAPDLPAHRGQYPLDGGRAVSSGADFCWTQPRSGVSLLDAALDSRRLCGSFLETARLRICRSNPRSCAGRYRHPSQAHSRPV